MTLVVVALIAITVAQASPSPNVAGQPCTPAALVGTWTQVDNQLGDEAAVTIGPNDPVGYKHITPTHFVVYQVAAGGTNAMRSAHGGTYTLAAGIYTETVQHGFGPPFEVVGGKSIAFQCSMEGNDRWRISGQIDETPLKETWKRVSAGPKPKP
jgi:hypothetical protein